MTSTEIREALTEVQHAVEIPPVDQLAFRARVRAERRRHVASRAVLAGAAAAVLAAGAVSVAHLVDGRHGSTRGRSLPAHRRRRRRMISRR